MPKESFWIMRPFNALFFCIFGFFIALLVVSSLLLRNKEDKTRRIVLCTACIVTAIGFFVYKYFLSIDVEYDQVAYASMGGFNWWGELPLHLCNINMILIPIGVWRKNRSLMSFSFFTGTLGATMALLMPSMGFAGYPIFMPRMIGFWGTHFMVLIEAIALATYGLYRPKYKDLPKTTLTIVIVTFCIFLIDVFIRVTGLNPHANYFFAMETEGNPVLNIFHNLIPVPFLYMIPCLIVLVPYMSLIILGFHLADKHKKPELVQNQEPEQEAEPEQKPAQEPEQEPVQEP